MVAKAMEATDSIALSCVSSLINCLPLKVILIFVNPVGLLSSSWPEGELEKTGTDHIC